MYKINEINGPQKAIDVYETLRARYASDGFAKEEIGQLVVLNMPDNWYFNRQGIYNYHAGGQTAVNDETITRWVLRQKKP